MKSSNSLIYKASVAKQGQFYYTRVCCFSENRFLFSLVGKKPSLNFAKTLQKAREIAKSKISNPKSQVFSLNLAKTHPKAIPTILASQIAAGNALSKASMGSNQGLKPQAWGTMLASRISA